MCDRTPMDNTRPHLSGSRRAPDRTTQHVGLGARLSHELIRLCIHGLLTAHQMALRIGRWVRGSPRALPEEGIELLLTGTFYSENWIRAHLEPLVGARRCGRVRIVATTAMPRLEKVELIRPPRWLVRIIGAVPARLATFAWVSLRTRPHFVGGFHLLLNGLAAAVVARWAGARALYFCVGGPAELLGGGAQSENRLFERLRVPDPVVERRLIEAVGEFDLVITMGTGAVRFFRRHGIETEFHVVSGGISGSRFQTESTRPIADLIFVGRLAPIKRVDLLLRALALVRESRPGTSALVVGDGAERARLEALTRSLQLEGAVTFVGQRSDVERWLRRARIFVLPSDSEGLSLSLMEAMAAGLAPVVSHVGELGDLVEDGVTGCLVEGRTPEAFAARICELLNDPARLRSVQEAARKAAARHEMARVAETWDRVLQAMGRPRAPGALAHDDANAGRRDADAMAVSDSSMSRGNRR
jgi:L-malate glycosyltransferase